MVALFISLKLGLRFLVDFYRYAVENPRGLVAMCYAELTATNGVDNTSLYR